MRCEPHGQGNEKMRKLENEKMRCEPHGQGNEKMNSDKNHFLTGQTCRTNWIS